jgi:hypothetical protein
MRKGKDRSGSHGRGELSRATGVKRCRAVPVNPAIVSGHRIAEGTTPSAFTRREATGPPKNMDRRYHEKSHLQRHASGFDAEREGYYFGLTQPLVQKGIMSHNLFCD